MAGAVPLRNSAVADLGTERHAANTSEICENLPHEARIIADLKYCWSSFSVSFIAVFIPVCSLFYTTQMFVSLHLYKTSADTVLDAADFGSLYIIYQPVFSWILLLIGLEIEQKLRVLKLKPRGIYFRLFSGSYVVFYCLLFVYFFILAEVTYLYEIGGVRYFFYDLLSFSLSFLYSFVGLYFVYLLCFGFHNGTWPRRLGRLKGANGSNGNAQSIA